MSVIVALKDHGALYFAADSQSTDGTEASFGGEPKIWQDGAIVYGVTGTRRLNNTVRHCVHAGEINAEPLAWLVTTYVPALKAAVTEHGGADKDGDLDGSLMLGIAGRIFRIDTGRGVLEITADYEAIGCGSPYALGALHANKAREARPRVMGAIAAAVQFDVYCGGPTVVLKAENAQ